MKLPATSAVIRRVNDKASCACRMRTVATSGWIAALQTAKAMIAILKRKAAMANSGYRSFTQSNWPTSLAGRARTRNTV